MSGQSGEVTRLLEQVRQGSQDAAERLVPLVYDELRRMAGAYLRNERPGHTLQATALVHEAYLKLAGPQAAQNRAHFLAIAANTMRRVLMNHARDRKAAKRGGGARRVDLDAELLVSDGAFDGVMAIDEALEKLAAIDPRQAQLIEYRFFGGMDVEETAEAMGISTATVKREWRLAKAWLTRELAAERPG